jgi:O-acetyl-ADP-ribose deacetylase (regulator of RNase III)
MTAGIDAAVVAHCGAPIMTAVQRRIMDDYLGEQPVGSAFILPTANALHPYLCHAPTMRIPCDISGTDRVYAATWAALLAIYAHNRAGASSPIRTVAIPAMGTGFGRVPYEESARQMATAWSHFLHPPRASTSTGPSRATRPSPTTAKPESRATDL